MARADLHVCVRWKRKSSECGQRSLFLLARDVQIFSPMNQPLWGGLSSGQAQLETNPDVCRLLRTLRDPPNRHSGPFQRRTTATRPSFSLISRSVEDRDGNSVTGGCLRRTSM